MSSEEVDRAETPAGAASTGDPGDRGESTLNLADPKAMRAMAHPVRMALMELLAVAPTLTATQASEALGESPANCAFHLRTLAKYGFVREAGGGKGRERPWTRAHRSISLSTESQADYQAELAAQALSQAYGERMIERIRYVYGNTSWPKGWEHAVISSDSVRFLTAEEALGVEREIRAIIDRHEDRRADPGARPAGALPVQIAHYIFPMAELAGLAGQPGRPQAADSDR